MEVLKQHLIMEKILSQRHCFVDHLSSNVVCGYMDHDDDRSGPSVPVAELRGHEHGPIHIVRFTG